MTRGKLIAFIGIDGSGKTTQTSILINQLKKNKKKVVQINAFSYLLLRFLINFLKKKSKKESKENNPLLNYEKKCLIFNLFPVFALIDNWLFFLTKILPVLYKNDYVVCDRYFYDFGPSYLEFGYGNLPIIKFYLKFLPRPDFTFWLNLPAKEAFTRKKEFNLGFIKSLGKKYLLLFENWKSVFEIDGRESEKKISRIVFETIFNHKCELCSSKKRHIIFKKK